jgi:hypothetical protein
MVQFGEQVWIYSPACLIPAHHCTIRQGFRMTPFIEKQVGLLKSGYWLNYDYECPGFDLHWKKITCRESFTPSPWNVLATVLVTVPGLAYFNAWYGWPYPILAILFRSFGFIAPKTLNYWWRLLQKRVVRTKFDVYVFIPLNKEGTHTSFMSRG